MGLAVIIPAYNAEKTIQNCIKSVAKNSIVEEILIVDDGSNDNTVEIVEQMTVLDGRIRLVVQKNSGPFIARMNGVSNAKSEYVTFVDADDFVNDYAYDTIFGSYDLNKIDVLEFGWSEITEDGKVIGGSKLKNKLYSGECARHFAEQKNASNFLWNKIFKRKILNEIEVLPLRYSEDACFLAQIYLKADKCLVVREKFYNYVFYKSSLAHRPYNEKFFDNIVGWRYVRNLYADKRPELIKPVDVKLCSLAVILYCKCPLSEKKKYLDVFKEHRKNITFFTVMRYGSFKRKIMILMFPRFKKFVEKRLK